MELLKKVRKTIKKYSMLSESNSILIGLSGGPDSVCMTIILDKLRKDFNLSLHAVYVDHGLRPDEVLEEKEFCKKLCERLGIGFFSKSVNVSKYAKYKKLNKQEAARELRYKVFEEISKKTKSAKIALGHTADDQAETFLMRLLRGSGSRGLLVIPPVRGMIIRPLIEIEREEIEEFLIAHSSLITYNSSLPYMVDSSNVKSDYFRNWIRHMIIPELKKKNPALLKSICRTADILREEDAYLEFIVNKTLMRLISRKNDDSIELFLVPLETMEKPILRRVLRRAISETRGLRGIDFLHIEDIIKLVKSGGSGDSISLPGGIRVIKSYSTLLLTLHHPPKLKTRTFNVPGELVLSEAGIVLKAELSDECYKEFDNRDTAVFDFASLNFPLKVRMRKKGDYFYPAGFGRKKKLQDFFVDEKVPRDERDRVPVVLSGNDIIWVAGYRADERFKTTDRTEKFLRLIISRGKS